MNKIIVGLAAIFFYSSSSIAAQLYKWTDENGQVHFSQSKPKHQDPERLRIKEQRRSASISREQLIGEWRSDDDGKEVFVLTENGFTVDKQKGGEIAHMSGTWQLMSGRILLNITKGYIERGSSIRNSQRKSLKGVKLSALITHISENELKIMDSNGRTNYTRSPN